MNESGPIPVYLIPHPMCRELNPQGCPHTDAEQFRIRGRDYLIIKPGCRPSHSFPTGRIREFAFEVEELFGLHLYSGREIHNILDQHYPTFWKYYKDTAPHPVEYAAYHSSWTAYWTIRDVIPHLAKRPKCETCGKGSSQWETIPYRTNERQLLELGSMGYCSKRCYDNHIKRLVRLDRRREREFRWLRIGRQRLKELRAYLRANLNPRA